jgi:PIN domain nuclease of toxin-antitoxin system
MKFVAVADTHAVLWYLLNDPRLSTAARDVFDLADSTKNSIVLSPISLVEVTYLVEKNRIPELAYTLLVNALAEPDNLFVEAPLSASVAISLRLVSRSEVPDMPDRIIAATALHFNIPILSCDRRIRAANLTTIW